MIDKWLNVNEILPIVQALVRHTHKHQKSLFHTRGGLIHPSKSIPPPSTSQYFLKYTVYVGK
jgi:hypothetical protein